MTDLSTESRNQLHDYVERIESLMIEKKEAAEKIKAEYAQAAGDGFDKKAIAQLLKERLSDREKTIEHRNVVATYRQALSSFAGTPLGDWARKWLADEARHSRRKTEPRPLDEWMTSRKPKKDEGDRDGPAP